MIKSFLLLTLIICSPVVATEKYSNEELAAIELTAIFFPEIKLERFQEDTAIQAKKDACKKNREKRDGQLARWRKRQEQRALQELSN